MDALPLSEVISIASRVLDDGSLGALSGGLACAAGASRGSALLLFLARFGLWPRLADAEFVAGLRGASAPSAPPLRLSGPRVIRLALATAASAPRGAAAVLSLLRAGALDGGDLLSRRSLAALHGLLRVPEGEAAAGALLAGVAGDMDSFAEVGALLARFLAGAGAAAPPLPPAQARAIIARVCASEDVRDLAGSPQALMAALPAHAEAIAEALAAAADDSDADEAGNLAGFVCGDDQIEYSSDEEGEEEEYDDDDDDGNDDDDEDDETDGDARRQPPPPPPPPKIGAAGGRARALSSTSAASSLPPIVGRRTWTAPVDAAPAAKRRRVDAGQAGAAAAARYVDGMARR